MLTIKIEEDYKNALEEMNIEVPADCIVMTVRDSEILMGMGVMRLYDEYAIIDNIIFKDEFNDFTLEYGLGKSLLNVVDLRGIRYAVSNNKSIEKQLRALKFKSPSEIKNIDEYPPKVALCDLCLNLDGYFLANC